MKNVNGKKEKADSNIALSTKVYKNVDLRNSVVGEMSIIGDNSFLLNCNIDSNVSINKRNHLQQSLVQKYTYTGVNTVIKYAEIGSFCSISWNVSIGGKNHDYNNVTTNSKWWFHKLNTGQSIKTTDYSDSGKCIVGNDVWIASNVIILRDIKIGSGAVIGAGAVVTKDVPPYTVIAGVPAKPIKKRFDDDTINALLELAWWDWPVEVIKQNLDLIYSTKVDDQVLAKLQEIKKGL